MGRYVVLLLAPFIIGVLIAAGLVLVEGLRRRLGDARRARLEALDDPELLDDGPDAEEQASELPRRRIAS
jgi:hypothetical protein